MQAKSVVATHPAFQGMSCTADAGCINPASRNVVDDDGTVYAAGVCRIHAVRIAIGINDLAEITVEERE